MSFEWIEERTGLFRECRGKVTELGNKLLTYLEKGHLFRVYHTDSTTLCSELFVLYPEKQNFFLGSNSNSNGLRSLNSLKSANVDGFESLDAKQCCEVHWFSLSPEIKGSPAALGKILVGLVGLLEDTGKSFVSFVFNSNDSIAEVYKELGVPVVLKYQDSGRCISLIETEKFVKSVSEYTGRIMVKDFLEKRETEKKQPKKTFWQSLNLA